MDEKLHKESMGETRSHNDVKVRRDDTFGGVRDRLRHMLNFPTFSRRVSPVYKCFRFQRKSIV